MDKKLGIAELHGPRFSAFIHPKLLFDDGECSKIEGLRWGRREIVGTLHRIDAVQ